MSEVLIVEDEPKLAAVLTEYLELAGHRTHTVADGRHVVDRVRSHAPAVVLLDVMLPGKDGLQVCREIRAFSTVPILMVTARVEEIDRLLGLELGADDYVCKPFSPREVVARVKAILRRSSEYSRSEPAQDGFSIDRDRHTASLDGRLLELTPVELRLLRTLLDPPGRVWSRNQLLDKIYADHRIVSDRTVDSHVKNLRRKLKAVRPHSECISSVYGVGYKLDA